MKLIFLKFMFRPGKTNLKLPGFDFRQKPTRAHPSPSFSPSTPTNYHDADLCTHPHWPQHRARGRAQRLDRQRQGQDPGQGGHPPGPAAAHLCGQAARGRPRALRLQRPEGEHTPPGPAPARRLVPGCSCVVCCFCLLIMFDGFYVPGRLKGDVNIARVEPPKHSIASFRWIMAPVMMFPQKL